jgi:hypothetical protein
VQGRALLGGRGARGAAAVVVSGGKSWTLLGAMPGGEREGEREREQEASCGRGTVARV